MKSKRPPYHTHLALDKRLAPLLEALPVMVIEPKQDVWFYLTASIMSQQLSTKVASVIRGRFVGLYEGKPSPERVLEKSGSWKSKHTKFFKLIMKWMAKRDTKVIYLRGNHDDFLEEILPFSLGNFSIKQHHILHSGPNRYYVVHGDIFDTVTTRLKWLAKLGDVGYTMLLWMNRHYNNYRVRKGLPYYSLSQVVKQKVKQAVSFISDFEEQLAEVAKANRCQGVICGHIHQAANKMIGNVHYLNSGDWVETLSALVEDEYGHWEILYYADWIKSLDTTDQAPVLAAAPADWLFQPA